MMWMLLTLLYGTLKGVREIAKKKALLKNSVMEVLFVYSLLAFLMTIPTASDALSLPRNYFYLIPIKSFVIFLAWILSFHAIKKIAISTYGVLDLSRVLFSTFLGVTVLSESLDTYHIIGLILVCLGLLYLPYQKNEKIDSQRNTSSLDVRQQNKKNILYIVAAFLSCLLNAVSGLMDKLFMKDISSSQLQFWYMFFLVLFYLLYILIRRIPLHLSALKNGWIWLLSILFVIADKALFIANAYPDSRVTVMTVLKQAGCIVTILAGKYIFKEKNTNHKLVCAVIIIIGIVVCALS